VFVSGDEMLKKIIAAVDRLDWRFKAFVVVCILLPIYFSSAPEQQEVVSTPIAQPENQPKNIVRSRVPIPGSEQGAGSPQREQKTASDGISAASPLPQPTRTEREHERREAPVRAPESISSRQSQVIPQTSSAPDRPGAPAPGSQDNVASVVLPATTNTPLIIPAPGQSQRVGPTVTRRPASDARNLAACLNGYLTCDKKLLTDDEREQVQASDIRRNLAACLNGYLTCDERLLTRDELVQVRARRSRRN
jgi:hypothetical protein